MFIVVDTLNLIHSDLHAAANKSLTLMSQRGTASGLKFSLETQPNLVDLQSQKPQTVLGHKDFSFWGHPPGPLPELCL